MSPDGRRLAWLAPAGGRVTVHVRDLEGDEVRVIDTHSRRGLRTCWWAADSRHLLFTQDQAGDRNQHVYLADTERPGGRYIRFGLGRDFDPAHPTWREHLAGLRHTDDGREWTYRFYLERSAPMAAPPVVATFGCFS